jgi:hypothetical protein
MDGTEDAMNGKYRTPYVRLGPKPPFCILSERHRMWTGGVPWGGLLTGMFRRGRRVARMRG